MADYKYLVTDAATGDNIDEIPLEGVQFAYGLNTPGTLTATFPPDAYFAQPDVFGGPDSVREITVLRDDKCRWNGPITNLSGSRRGGWSLTAREPTWYFSKRSIEEDLVYTSEDIFQIVRDLFTYATTKTANGSDGMTSGADINADLPRFSVMSGTAGVAKSYTFGGNVGHLISEAIDNALIADPTTGLDYAVDYISGTTRQRCIRTLKLGSPSLGVQQEIQLRNDDLYDYGLIDDLEQAATRVTVIGQNGYVKRLQNSGAVAIGAVLLESVTDRQDLAATSAVDDFAMDDRRARQPPVAQWWVEFVPDDGKLSFDLYSVGDMVPLDVRGPGLFSASGISYRATQIDVFPPAKGSPERVRLSLGTLVSELGA